MESGSPKSWWGGQVFHGRAVKGNPWEHGANQTHVFVHRSEFFGSNNIMELLHTRMHKRHHELWASNSECAIALPTKLKDVMYVVLH